MSHPFRNSVQKVLTSTTAAISWSISVADTFDVNRIDIHWGSAPTTAESITFTKVVALGSAYNTVLFTYTVPVATTDLSLPGNVSGSPAFSGFVSGDTLLITYANTNAKSVSGTATVSY